MFGPSAKAAQLEGSKAFLKVRAACALHSTAAAEAQATDEACSGALRAQDVCQEYGIPTAQHQRFSEPARAKEYVRRQGVPIVIKADGLAAGKGVYVAHTEQDALAAVDAILVHRQFGDAGAPGCQCCWRPAWPTRFSWVVSRPQHWVSRAGNELIVEEFLDGEEASFFALVDGTTCVALASAQVRCCQRALAGSLRDGLLTACGALAQDHKAVGEGDTGPNTGGMGAYSPAPVVTADVEAQVMRDIVQRTADAMVDRGVPFSGVLFAGLMIKDGRVRRRPCKPGRPGLACHGRPACSQTANIRG